MQDHDVTRDIAAAVNEAYASIENTKRRDVKSASALGRLLIEASNLVPKSSWEQWLSRETVVSLRTAKLYMCVAKHVEDQNLCDAGIADRLLSVPDGY